MKRAARFFLRLYPARWRARYGEEFETLIEDSSPGWRALFDVVKGAIRMQLHLPAFPKLAVMLSLLGLAAGFGVSWLVTPRYVSTAEMQLIYAPAARPEGRVNLNGRVIQMEQEILSRTSLSRIIQDPRLDLYRRERENTPLEDVIEKMRTQDIKIRIESATSDYVPFTISFAYSDRIKARQTVQALISRFSDANLISQRTAAQMNWARSAVQIERLEARIATLEKRLGIVSSPAGQPEQFVPQVDGINLDVLDVPSLPVDPVYPNRAVFMGSGFGTGFAAALVIAVFRRRPPAIPFPAQTA